MLGNLIDFEGMFLEGAPVKAKVGVKAKVVAKAPVKAKIAVKAPAKPAAPKPAVKAQVKASVSAKTPKSATSKSKTPAPKRTKKKSVFARAAAAATGAAKSKINFMAASQLPSISRVSPQARPESTIAERTQVAAKIASNMATGLAAKLKTAAARKPDAAPSASVSTRKAVAAVAPIAQACNCPPQDVVRKVDAQMACQGFPVGTAKGLFAKFHDMAQSVEKAANQRIATLEHKQKTSEESFRCQLLRKLQTLAQCLPENHPTRVRTNVAILKGT